MLMDGVIFGKMLRIRLLEFTVETDAQLFVAINSQLTVSPSCKVDMVKLEDWMPLY